MASMLPPRRSGRGDGWMTGRWAKHARGLLRLGGDMWVAVTGRWTGEHGNCASSQCVTFNHIQTLAHLTHHLQQHAAPAWTRHPMPQCRCPAPAAVAGPVQRRMKQATVTARYGSVPCTHTHGHHPRSPAKPQTHVDPEGHRINGAPASASNIAHHSAFPHHSLAHPEPARLPVYSQALHCDPCKQGTHDACVHHASHGAPPPHNRLTYKWTPQALKPLPPGCTGAGASPRPLQPITWAFIHCCSTQEPTCYTPAPLVLLPPGVLPADKPC